VLLEVFSQRLDLYHHVGRTLLAGGAFVEEEVWLQVVGVLGLGKDLLRIKGVVARLLENGEDQAQERGLFVEGGPLLPAL
jgi:hypothetical protein